MKHIIRSAAIIVLSVVFLVGMTGVSFFIHECSSSKKKEITAFPEFFNQGSSCCCAETARSNSSCTPIEYAASSCCKNTRVFLKTAVTGFPVISKIFESSFTDYFADFYPLINCEPEKDPFLNYISLLDHSPPLSGKQLILSIHQIKIPFPVS